MNVKGLDPNLIVNHKKLKDAKLQPGDLFIKDGQIITTIQFDNRAYFADLKNHKLYFDAISFKLPISITKVIESGAFKVFEYISVDDIENFNIDVELK